MFDEETERCFDCDGHWKHHEGCPYFTPREPVNPIQAWEDFEARQLPNGW